MNQDNPILQRFINHLIEVISIDYGDTYRTLIEKGVKQDITLRSVLIWQSEYQHSKKDNQLGIISPIEWEEKRKKCVANINNCIFQLREDELEDDVLKSFAEEEMNDLNSDTNASTVDNDFIADREQPLFIKKVNLYDIKIEAIEIPDHSDILDIGEKRYEFRKRMTWIQDYLTLESYGKALYECEYILKNLELQSGQLYQYYTICFFKTKGEEYIIVQDIAENNDDNFKQLILLIKRSRLFYKTTSEEFENKIEYICYRMSWILREKYKAMNTLHNYITQDDNQGLRNTISKFISTGLTLSDEIHKRQPLITIFLEYALTELNGGGRLEWFTVTDDWQIKNRDNYPALEYRNKIISILKRTNSWEVCKKRLHRNLSTKYSKIKINNSESHIEERKALRRFFKASIIAYDCFKDIRFLEFFKSELLHTGKLNWFQLGEINSKFIANAETQRIGYNPVNDLMRLKFRFDEYEMEESIKTLYSELKRQREIEIVQNQVLEIDEKYRKLKSQTHNRDIHFRKEVIECINQWQNAYEKVKYDEFINRAIKELIGSDSILFWFELIEDLKIINNKECQNIGYGAISNLNNFMDLSKNYYQKKAATWQDIQLNAAKILEQEANQKYNQL